MSHKEHSCLIRKVPSDRNVSQLPAKYFPTVYQDVMLYLHDNKNVYMQKWLFKIAVHTCCCLCQQNMLRERLSL